MNIILEYLSNDPTKSLNPGLSAQVVTASQKIKEAKVVGDLTNRELSQNPAVPGLPSPPTSNLITKLFPLLGTEKHVTPTSTTGVKMVYKYVCMSVLITLTMLYTIEEESPRTVSLKEELETKRYQLELEIDRFKRENTAIGKPRLEKEVSGIT